MDSFKIVQNGKDVLFDRNEVHKVYREWRKLFNEYNPPKFAVAEAYVRAKRRMLYARPDELGQAFNFDLLGAEYDAKAFKRIISENLKLAKSEGSSSTWVLDNHDRVRHATRYGLPKKTDLRMWLLSDGKSHEVDRELGLARARAATLFLLALPGCTYMYQGEELGLFEVHRIIRKEKPSGLALIHTEKGRDGCRVPLPWSPVGKSFGFSKTGKSHLPQPSSFKDFAVDIQKGIKGTTLEMYKDALKLRKILQTEEELKWISTSSTEVIHFARPNGWNCIMNFNGKPYKMPKGEILMVSGPLKAGKIPANTTVWFKA